MIPTRTHGMIDYAMGLLLIAAPWLFGFADVSAAARWVPIVLGIVVLATALMTNFELGMVRMIPMPVHLGLDVAVGLVLIASPWIFGFSGQVWMPHVILGIAEIGVAAMTQRAPAMHHLPTQTVRG